MKKRIFRGASFMILALSLPAIGWTVNQKVEFSDAPVAKTQQITPTTTVSEIVTATELFNQHISDIYNEMNLENTSLNFEVFRKALTGYYNFQNSGAISSEKQVISIVDFNKPSTQKRLWIIDLASRKLLFNTFVAHGRGSGNNYATTFSNQANSHQSSLGFYVTNSVYYGKHGRSLKLDGMDRGHNSNALNRAIVIHGAEYVSQSFINQHGRLGRSHGCPAVPVELTPAIIDTIKGKTTLFINGPATKAYSSNYLNAELAANLFLTKASLKTATL